MTVQPDLCQTCSETTSLVFSRDGSFVSSFLEIKLGFNIETAEEVRSVRDKSATTERNLLVLACKG